MRGYFVTGTDTGVGKTTVGAGLLAAAVARGMTAAALKPAETGCSTTAQGTLAPADALLLRRAAGRDAVPIEIVAPHRYRTPVAPAVAARLEGDPFSLDTVLSSAAALRDLAPDVLVVEGAGGLLVPYSPELDGAAVAAALGFPLLVVGRASLGTINHTLLTLREAQRRGLPVAAVILSRVLPDEGPDEAHNIAEIAARTDVPVLGPLPHLPAGSREDPAELAAALAGAVDLSLLLGPPAA